MRRKGILLLALGLFFWNTLGSVEAFAASSPILTVAQAWYQFWA